MEFNSTKLYWEIKTSPLFKEQADWLLIADDQVNPLSEMFDILLDKYVALLKLTLAALRSGAL